MADVNNLTADVSSLSLGADGIAFNKLVKKGFTSDARKAEQQFKLFDKDRDGYLDRKEFHTLLLTTFQKNGHPYRFTDKQERDFLRLLDTDKDGKLSLDEFKLAWQHWLKQILDPVSALIVVDVQNDFISGTLSLKNCPAGQDGEAVVPVINALLESTKFDIVVYSIDWHPANHISFLENVRKRKLHSSCKVKASEAKQYDTVIFEGPPQTEQVLWPAHCIQNSKGAELHPDLKVVKGSVHINKGTNPEIDSYSAFWDNNKLSQTDLLSELNQRKVTDVFVCGVAYDVCVASTVIHSLEHGFRTVVVEDGCRGVSLPDIETMKVKMQKQGAVIVNSSEVPSMVAAIDRRPELGYQAAINFATARRISKGSNNKK